MATGILAADEPWRQLYQAAEAKGPQVIGLWQFLPGAETADSSGNGHDLTLRGDSRFAAEGRFGSCLESFAADPAGRQRNGASAGNQASLTPAGAFTLEAWIRPKAELFQQSVAFVIDKKYFHAVSDRPNANHDYQLTLRRSGRKHYLVAFLGYGDDSALYRSSEVEFNEGQWAYIAFTYNGAGMGRFFLDGEPVGETYHAGRGPVARGRHPLVFGDRVGSSFQGFAGYIDQVRISNGTPDWLAPRASANVAGGRTVFERMEPNARFAVAISNGLDVPLRDLRASLSCEETPLSESQVLADVPARQAMQVEFDIKTDLRPGTYPVAVRFAGQANGEAVAFETTGTLTITGRPLPNQMPVVMWGSAGIETLREIGFTHSLLWMADHTGVWQAGAPLVPVRSADRMAETIAQLDERLAAGQRFLAIVRPGKWVVAEGPNVADRRARFARVDRSGELYSRTNVCGLFPEVQQFCWNVGASVGQSFGSHPAFDGALVHSEVRDGSNLCFHDHCRQAYHHHAGREIPAEIVSRSGVSAGRRSEFVPYHGVVDDDHPILAYLRWFWREGDGWNELHSQTHRGLKTGTRDGFWTFFDPAVRCPPIWGSGGEVDVLSQWTYTYPDPPRVGLATDQLFAMAEGRPGQRVMKMTQVIWYRTQTAPNLPQREEDRTDWERAEPEARFITIAPDHLREAFWHKIARPVQGIMYHGIGSLVPGTSSGYRYTNPHARETLAELTRDVVQPLGPALMQIPDPPSDVAMLESFTSMAFGADPTWGWGRGWVAEVHQILQWARLQPRVMYEDTIMRDGLAGIRVLVLPKCAVLPQGVADRIIEFQRQGGLVVGDRHLAAAIIPDVLIETPSSSRTPDQRKADLQALAEQLRAELAPVYSWVADSSDPDVIVRRRAYGETSYLFAINDRRTYGDYVGQHRRVMEQGLPHEATLLVAQPGAVVYDLLAARQIETQPSATGIAWNATLAPGAGRLYMISPRAVAAVVVDVAARRAADRNVEVQIRVVDDSGQRLDAVIPLKVDVLDPHGRSAEFSGHYGAKDGMVTIRLDLAENDAEGEWTIRAREGASGRAAETRFHYQR